MTFNPEIVVCDAAEELSRTACKMILDIVGAAERKTWPLSIALSGGSTPKMLYTRLHDEHLPLLREERALRFFFGDERLVPADTADSNYNMAKQALLRDIPDDLVVPFDVSGLHASPQATRADAENAANAYEKRLAALLPLCAVEGTDAQVPVFDIVLLGLGADGHTASIFPGTQAERDDHRAVSVSFPSATMRPQVWRATLTPAAITHARHVIVLATGNEKKWVLNGILAESPAEAPVSRFLRSCKGKVTFVVDRDISLGVPQ
ncbi:6-phosphogluconolactonase [Trypanosoma grayi]|uniref:6-phosphogluconolactonase n=1 Tax=Trypanosoma grayi TaxID=71804 RepID=UPI0004F431DA|nr:6-phosphogluconolactonase [Trypanosoma grayi]KEG10754.1 6-phosphogluconolactonase [Trypanosoma grayi]